MSTVPCACAPHASLLHYCMPPPAVLLQQLSPLGRPDGSVRGERVVGGMGVSMYDCVGDEDATRLPACMLRTLMRSTGQRVTDGSCPCPKHLLAATTAAQHSCTSLTPDWGAAQQLGRFITAKHPATLITHTQPNTKTLSQLHTAHQARAPHMPACCNTCAPPPRVPLQQPQPASSPHAARTAVNNAHWIIALPARLFPKLPPLLGGLGLGRRPGPGLANCVHVRGGIGSHIQHLKHSAAVRNTTLSC